MTSFVDQILTVSPVLVYLLVGLLVFAEDAIFVGFVIPGETAAILGGVDASRGNVSLVAIMAIVVGGAILGDTVGYEVGKHLGARVLRWHVLDKRRGRIDDARDLLSRRGGVAVFLGRFVAFFRAVMPALAGTSRMPYLRFLRWNALGGLVWGIGFTLLGYLAGNSYEAVARTVGRTAAIVVAAVVVVGIVVWRVWRHRHPRERAGADATDDAGAGSDGDGQPAGAANG